MVNHSTRRRYPWIYVIFVLIFVYAVQDFFNSENIGLRQVNRQSVYVLLSVLICMVALHYGGALKKRDFHVSKTEVRLFSIALWVIVSNMINGLDIWSALVHIGISILWLFVYAFFRFYGTYFSDSQRQILKCIFILFLFYLFANLYAKNSIEAIYNRFAVVNVSYHLLALLPWLVLNRKGKLRSSIIIITVIVVFISLKRGAILALTAMLVVRLFAEGRVQRRHIKTMATVIGLCVLAVVVFALVDNMTGGYFAGRFSISALSSGSGRSVIYSSAIGNIAERTGMALMFGIGSGSSRLVIGAAAHNDWIEFAFSFGLVGLTLYSILTFSLVSRSVRLVRKKSSYCSAYAAAVTYWILVSLYGMVYFAHSTLYVIAFLGFLDGLSVSTRRAEGADA